MHGWVDNVGYLDFYALLSNPGSPGAETAEGVFLMIQSAAGSESLWLGEETAIGS